ncbi:MAG: hypothetical protein IJA81_02510 [Akkermansia sp.]|nr:hypothetical protein [Akkermansia sp.]
MQLRKTYTDGSKTHLVTELQDAYGRSAGYTYTKDGAVQQTVSTDMSLTISYEAQRDLLTGMVYKRSNTTVATRRI